MQNPILSLCINMILRLMKCIWPTPVIGNCISMVSPVWLVLNMCFVGASNFLFLGSSWQYCLTMISLSFESYETTTSRFWLLRKLHVSISDITIKKTHFLQVTVSSCIHGAKVWTSIHLCAVNPTLRSEALCDRSSGYSSRKWHWCPYSWVGLTVDHWRSHWDAK